MNFCPTCGQENDEKKAPLGVLIRDALSDYFVFDSKLFRGLGSLMVKPGLLTSQFNNGQRARNYLPFRMYLFISFVYFFVMSLDGPQATDSGIDIGQLNSIDTIKNKGVSFSVNDSTIKYDSVEQLTLEIEKQGMEGYLDSLNVEGYWPRLLVKQVLMAAKDKGESFLQRFKENVPIAMFFLMPLFAVWLKLFFRNQQRYYVEHLVFSFHIHSFFFLFSTLHRLINLYVVNLENINLYWFNFDGDLLTLMVLTVYSILALKKVYGGSYGPIIKKFIGITLMYTMCIGIVLAGTALISLMFI